VLEKLIFLDNKDIPDTVLPKRRHPLNRRTVKTDLLRTQHSLPTMVDTM
jgi:hypothetical protein